MLDVTINQNMNCMSSGSVATASSSLEDDMDHSFDNDWLHEHNLDILFDLFEEEVERKGAGANCHHSQPHSSTILGTSPVTSYLFGTSPSLALDLYDLFYFDNQQPISSTSSSSNNSSSNVNSNISNTYNFDESCTTVNENLQQQANLNDNATQSVANSITNSMRIKRKLKKGESEGVSLLARPLTSNSASSGYRGCSNNNINVKDKNHSDKTSAKLTNLKKSIIGNNYNRKTSGGIDINYTRQNNNNRIKQQNLHYHHVHYITGCAVIREHAYAVRGH